MKKYDLFDLSPNPPKDYSKEKYQKKNQELVKELAELQNIMFAECKWSLLIVMQGMDASGKDGAVKKVFSGVNPAGVSVKTFRAPSKDELSHDFLWRVHPWAPAKGMISLFNRSHYEDLVTTKVLGIIDEKKAKKRVEIINDFEKMLEYNKTRVLKFFFHISKEAQQERFEERRTDPKKHWKYNSADLGTTEKWDDYMKTWSEAFESCGPDIPWTIVPSDKNWYKEYVFAHKIVETLKDMDLKYPGLPA